MEIGFEVCPAVVTVTGTELPCPAGTVQTMLVWVRDVTGKFVVPEVTVGLRPKLEPKRVSEVPPLVGNVAGVKLEIAGGR